MAKFKIKRGLAQNLNSVPVVDGEGYFCTDTGEFFIDVGNERIQTNAKLAKGLSDGENILEIDDINNLIVKSSAVSYECIIKVEDWVQQDDGIYAYVYNNNKITCGLNGNIPPIISPDINTNITEYSKIDEAIAESKIGITFFAKQIPNADLIIIVIDHSKINFFTEEG